MERNKMRFEIGTYKVGSKGTPELEVKRTIEAADYGEAIAIAKKELGRDSWCREPGQSSKGGKK
jgi:hypothetical protein